MDDTSTASETVCQKKELRRCIKEKLSNVTQNNRCEQSHKACELFLSSDVYKKASFILSYMAMDSEIDPLEIILRALSDNKKVALPKIVPHTSDMSFYCIDNNIQLDEQLNSGMWGIREPLGDDKKLYTVRASEEGTVVVIVPGVAFTKEGARLGHGRGYYDKYSALLKENATQSNRVILVGMCLEEQIVPSVPTDEFDIKMDYLLTASSLSKV